MTAYDHTLEFDGEEADDDELELSDDEEWMMHGCCHLFALALNRLTGLPLAAYVETRYDEDDADEPPILGLVHAFAIDGEAAIDIRGRVDFARILDPFDADDPDLIDINGRLLVRLGEGRSSLDITDRRWQIALTLAEQLTAKLGLATRSVSTVNQAFSSRLPEMRVQ